MLMIKKNTLEMKKQITIKALLALWVLMCPIFILAQPKMAVKVIPKAHIEGILGAGRADQTIHLRHFNGIDVPVKVDAKGHFSTDVFLAEPGFYKLDGLGALYLSPGDQLRLQLDKDGLYLFSGKGSAANTIYSGLKKSISGFLPYSEKTGLTAEAYQMDVPLFMQKIADFEAYSEKAVSKVPDPFFREIAMKDLRCFDNSLLYSCSRGEGSNLRKLDSTLKKQIADRVFYNLDPNDVKLFQNSENYRTAVELKIKYLMYTKIGSADMRNKEAKILMERKTAIELIREPYILDHFKCLYSIALIKAVPSARQDSIYKDFMAGNFTAAHKAEVERTYRKQIDYGDNGTAPDFSYEDVHGKKVKLSDLRGKYVYIDIWATWCGPCKAQIPYLAKLETDYHGKNIQFLSISIDEIKDKGKWADFVKEQRLGGIQVMADNAIQSDFIQKFGINAIPRFILIDPKGKIVSANAKRPGDPEIRKDLNALL